MTGLWLLYSTFQSTDEAISVARALLEARLIACANIHEKVTSLYRWEGEIRREPEVVMIAKTREEKLKTAIEKIRHLHSYELPCIAAYPIGEGLAPFLQWVEEETT